MLKFSSYFSQVLILCFSFWCLLAFWSTNIKATYLTHKLLIINLIWLSFKSLNPNDLCVCMCMCCVKPFSGFCVTCLGHTSIMIRSLQEENGLLNKEIAWNRGPKSIVLTPVWECVSCTICNLLATFSLWMLVERRGTLTGTSYGNNDILFFFLEAILQYVWNWAKGQFWLRGKRFRFHLTDKSANGQAQAVSTLHSSFACCIYRWKRMPGMYYLFSWVLFSFLFILLRWLIRRPVSDSVGTKETNKIFFLSFHFFENWTMRY